MKLRSGLAKHLNKPFVVHEDALIRIKNALEKASGNLEKKTRIVFRVFREDDRFYETEKLEEVLEDPNTNKKKIITLEVDLVDEEDSDNWIAKVEFIAERRLNFFYSERDEIHVKISGNDKKWSLILADDLEPQVERVVNKSKIPRWPIWGVAVCLVYLLYRFSMWFETWMTGNPVEEAYKGQYFSFAIFAICAIPFVLSQYMRSIAVNKLLGPEAVFLWGQQEVEFQNRERIRDNFYWVVVVGFVVSVLGSLAVGFLV